jgi:N-acetylglutamate synthase-like GNAT family acetyltransferase
VDNIDSRMLSALELLHYSQKFSGQLFAFFFDSSDDCEDLLTDLRVLHAASIRQALFCAADDTLLRKLDLWNRTGHKFLVQEVQDGELMSASFIGGIQRSLSAGHLPLIVLPSFPRDPRKQLEVKSQVIHCSVALGATKVFFPGPDADFRLGGRALSCPSSKQLDHALAHPEQTNLSPDQLEFFVGQQRLHRVEIVTVESKRGSIFREVFTHSGSGTLFTSEFPNVLRTAEESDVMDILAIMQPYVRAGTLKKLTEDELLSSIRSFTVYTVNDQIVALAALIDYEDCYELAKLCTLPRYQARGRARNLVIELQKKCREAGKRGLFALTVNESVGEFFLQMGFESCRRESLPQSWQNDYDFDRPSQSFWYSTAEPQPQGGNGSPGNIHPTA